MSGGSFNYLCYAEAPDLFNKRADLKSMAEALSGMGHIDAAAATEEVGLILNHFEAQMTARLGRLSKVWKAVEWKCSGDWSQAQLDEEMADYRKDVQPVYCPDCGATLPTHKPGCHDGPPR